MLLRDWLGGGTLTGPHTRPNPETLDTAIPRTAVVIDLPHQPRTHRQGTSTGIVLYCFFMVPGAGLEPARSQ
ncbi:MAG: hypothetical protein CME47_04370 [Halieaceae bacterium]|nr:hypothetical protein [Halieaceae bacterium]